MDIYEAAVEALGQRAGTTIDDEEYTSIVAGSKDPKDALVVTISCSRAQNQRKEMFDKVVNSFHRFMEPLYRFRSSIDTMAQVSSIALFIWGPIKFALVVADDIHENVKIAMTKLGWILDNLPAIAEYRDFVSAQMHNPLRRPLIKLCVEFFTFCILAKRFTNASAVDTMYNATQIRNGFDTCISIIKEQLSIVQSISISQMHSLLSRTTSDVPVDTTTSCSHVGLGTTENCFYVPDLLSSSFIGRTEEIQWINRTLDLSMELLGRRRAAIFGMTGVGKSQLLLRYVAVNRHKYKWTFWIVCGSQDKLMTSLQKVLDILGLPERSRPEAHVKLNALQNWLHRSREWLLIFDNVVGEEHYAIKDIIPSTNNGAVLFTSQRPGAMKVLVSRFELCLELPLFSEELALDLFLSKSECLRGVTDVDQEILRNVAKEITKELGLLPFAIDAAAAYIMATRLDLMFFLDNLKSHTGKEKFLNWKNDYAFDPERPTVSKAFLMSLNALEKTSPDVLDVLRLLSLFEPERIPALHLQDWRRVDTSELCLTNDSGKRAKGIALLKRLTCLKYSQGQNSRATRFSRLEIGEALGKLVEYSMIRQLPEKGVLWMHDLTRHHARRLVAREQEQEWLSAAIDVLYHTFPVKDTTKEERSLVDVFLPQTMSIIGQAQKANLSIQKYAKLMSICGMCHHNRGSYTIALECYHMAMPAIRLFLGEKSQHFINVQHRLGWSYRECGELKRCEEYHQRTIEARKRSLGPRADLTLDAISDLAFTIERQGRLKDGERMFKECYESQKVARGLGHPRTLAYAHNLALCFANQGRLDEAERLYRLILDESDRQQISITEPNRLKTLSTLALTLDHQGRLNDAEVLTQETLRGYKEIFGNMHLLTLRVRSNASGLHRSQGKFSLAEKEIRDVLPEYLRILGPDHFHVAIAHYDLGEVLHEYGRFEEGKTYYSLSIAVMESENGAPDHPLLLRTIDALAILQREIAELSIARSLAYMAYRRNLKLLGWNDPYTLVTANSHAEVLYSLGQLEEAKNLFSKVYQNMQNLLGHEHPHVFMVLNNLGQVSWKEIDPLNLDRSRDIFYRALDGFGFRLGRRHGCALVVRANIVRTLLMQEKHHEAAIAIDELWSDFVLFFGKDHPQCMALKYTMGVLALAQGQLPEAQQLFREVRQGWEKTFKSSHPDVLRSLAMEIRTTYNLGQDNHASILRSKIEKDEMNLINKERDADFDGLVSTTDLIFGNQPLSRYGIVAPIAYGSSARFRWGRKSCWREAVEMQLEI